MNPVKRFLTITFALFCATMPLAACSSNGGDSSGQLPQTSQSAGITRRTFLNTSQIVSSSPPVSSLTGTASMELDTATSRLAGGVTLSGAANAALAVHINDGDAGTNGDPVVSLTETPAGSGKWIIPDAAAALSAAQAERFKAAGLYVIVDTSANPGGEIRGQLLSYSENIQPIFDGHCVSCHGSAGAAGLALNKTSSYSRLVNQPAAQTSGVRVVPFDATGSVLYRRVSGTGFAGVSRMPPNGPYLSAADDGLLKTWISMGAIDDNGVSPNSTVQGTQFTRRAYL
ncbi:MAG TPA: CHRD domain-containing protein, partial [Nitrospirota bacterium]